MKKISIILSLIAAVTLVSVLSSCKMGCVKGSGNQTTETRKLGDFKSLDIEGDYQVNIKQDSSLGITITADDNLLKLIRTDVSGSRLHIHSKKNFCSSGKIVVNLGVKYLELLKAEGANEVTTTGRLNTKDFKLDLAGANRVTLDLSAANVSTEASGANEIHLSGQAAAHKVDLAGSGKIFAFDFVVGDYNIESAGASHCEINVLQNLKVHSVGASEVKYKGSPANIQNDKSGASSISKVE